MNYYILMLHFEVFESKHVWFCCCWPGT